MSACAFRVGTCSWTDRTLLASGFYPRDARSAQARLHFYASRFDTVEVDSSFYALPDPVYASKWIMSTPRNFLFGVKSFSLFTFHRARFASLPAWLRDELRSKTGERDVRREDLTSEQRVRLFEDFRVAVDLLHDAKKLGYLLFQFPPSWRYSKWNLAYIRKLRKICGPLPLALEVRHSSWLLPGSVEVFLDALRHENIAYVAVDEPDLSWTLPPEWPITAEWGTVARFHGRNADAWADSRASVHQKFDYDYRDDELAEWRLRSLGARRALEAMKHARPEKNIFLMFNNCVADKGVRNAATMKGLVGLAGSLPGDQISLQFDE